MTSRIDLPENRRLCFLLGWDPTEEVVRGKPQGFFSQLVTRFAPSSQLGDDSLGGPHYHDTCDLDLLCYVFDADKKLIDTIAPGTGRDINDNESIYHSGDEETGQAGTFDEELFIELNKLPPEIATILIAIRNDNDYEVGPETGAHIRLMDMTETQILLDQKIGFETNAKMGFILGRLVRGNGQWIYQAVNAYLSQHPDGNENAMLAAYLP